ncbi:MAG TPA: glycoside hydrolase [Thermoanaerobaculia bacterium]|nr:glycoside hydrolase [Thermoanaerobaculia bacterium]
MLHQRNESHSRSSPISSDHSPGWRTELQRALLISPFLRRCTLSLRRFLILGFFLASSVNAQQVDPRAYQELRYRFIGPFRGGRTVAAVGVRSRPGVFYIGANNGGVWKTNDYGRIWSPIFDDQPTQSIGAIAIAPSNPDIIYVGSGEGLQRPDLSTGDGIYKSTDAGKTWSHLGLRDAQQIPMIAIDPRNPNRLFVAALGHPYGPNEERGIFRSDDGGITFQKVLYKNENVGAMDVALDPSSPATVYAVLWEARNGPWENGYFTGPGVGLFKSTDSGATWKQLTNGLPGTADGVGRIGIEVSPGDTKRLFAVVASKKKAGVYRSNDAGESWELLNSDERLWSRDGDFQEIRVDPKNSDIVYVANVVTWKSTDGGKTFGAFRGAPGGDDYHRVWIDPDDSRVILIGSDQGAIVTVNGGESWSSWYNQPTAQMFHVSTDNTFPYRVCGGQQESGSACVPSRSDNGSITYRDWETPAAEEYGYAVPDPLDPDLVFGGKISRYDRRTRQSKDISPRVVSDPTYRVIRTEPIVFSPVDPHILYFASNTLWKTTTGGESWSQISPDLSRKEWEVPPNAGVYAATAKVTQRGVIYAVAPSPLNVNRIWAGTDDGLLHVTTDGGKSWKNVTPPQLRAWAKVSIIDASHFDEGEAYAAINTFRLDDLRPQILRTRDGGATWSEITSGIPAGGIVNVVREDPRTRGLLFAGTEQAVYVSFDDGDHWQSLRQNLPASSVRDLVIKGDDVVVATHGRGFWILDDIEPLRQIAARSANPGAAPLLFRPAAAIRFRWSKYPDTPLPPDESAGQNPPDGAILDYWLPAGISTPVTLEIADARGVVVRRFSSTDKAESPKDEGNVPWYWIRPERALPTTAGMHRFVWDLLITPMPGAKRTYPISAVPHDTAPNPTSPFVLPGTYIVKLSVNGRTLTQPLMVTMDPRVKTTVTDLQQQWTLSKQIYDRLIEAGAALDKLRARRAEIKSGQEKPGNPKALKEWDDAAAALEGKNPDVNDEEEASLPAGVDSLPTAIDSLRTLLAAIQNVDAAPTTQQASAITARLGVLDELMKRWRSIENR